MSTEKRRRNSDSELSDLEGGAPTCKKRKVAREQALKLSLSSGKYPQYLAQEGPYTPMNPRENNLLEYLLLLWPNSLVKLIVDETNRYALSKGKLKWVDVSKDEIWGFLGVVLEMGISHYWSSDSLLGVTDVRECMSLSRFWAIWSNVHVVDNSTLSPGDGLVAKIKPVLDVLSDTFMMNYSPAQERGHD